MYAHDDVIKWKHFPRYCPFVRGNHRWPVVPPHKGQWRGAFMFSLISTWTNGWANNRHAGDLRIHRAHYDVTEMVTSWLNTWFVPWISMMICRLSFYHDTCINYLTKHSYMYMWLNWTLVTSKPRFITSIMIMNACCQELGLRPIYWIV